MVRVSFLRRLFDSAYRRARRAEGRGDYRTAAVFYAEANAPVEAANALLFFATRTSAPEERIAAYEDALRWLPPDHGKRAEVEGRLGALVLEETQKRASLGRDDRQRLEQAAERLTRVGRHAEAATAWELLGRASEAAVALEAAGEIDRLERLLTQASSEEERNGRLRGLMSTYDMALASGARREARAALQQSVDLAREDVALAALLRRLDERTPRPFHVVLDIDGKRLTCIGRLPVTAGRAESDIRLRSSSVSREHARLDVDGERVRVEDLGSRNGTIVRGIPIASAIALAQGDQFSLGEDATLRVVHVGSGHAIVEVVRGMDAGACVLVGRGALPLLSGVSSVSFPDGHATLTSVATNVRLDARSCVAPIELLVGDVVTVGEARIEVVE